jgi:hypothetical protein
MNSQERQTISLNQETRDYIKLVAEAAVTSAIEHMKQNGFMPLVRETAREAVSKMLAEHGENCPFQRQVWTFAGKVGIGFLTICAIVGAVAYGIAHKVSGTGK